MLPQLDTPKYKLDLPSNGETIEYRPFLVKEEKILLLAMESMKEDNSDAIASATFDIIKSCTFNNVKPESLPNFDLDYLFLNIRSRSRGELIESAFVCQNEVDGEVCGTSNDVSVNINDIEVTFPEEDNSKVMITDEVGIQFKYLTTAELQYHDNEEDTIEKMFKVIVDSIDYVFDPEGVYKGSETSKAELSEFVENLSEDVFDKIKEYFKMQPQLRHTLDYKCSKCGYVEEVKLEGLEDFFGFA